MRLVLTSMLSLGFATQALAQGAEPPQWNASTVGGASGSGSDLFGPSWELIRQSFERPVPGDPPRIPPNR